MSLRAWIVECSFATNKVTLHPPPTPKKIIKKISAPYATGQLGPIGYCAVMNRWHAVFQAHNQCAAAIPDGSINRPDRKSVMQVDVRMSAGRGRPCGSVQLGSPGGVCPRDRSPLPKNLVNVFQEFRLKSGPLSLCAPGKTGSISQTTGSNSTQPDT